MSPSQDHGIYLDSRGRREHSSIKALEKSYFPLLFAVLRQTLRKALFDHPQQLLNIGKCRRRVVTEINEPSVIALPVRRGLIDHMSR